MKILWITNIKLPPLSKHLGEKPLVIGGWMISSLKQLQSQSDLEIAVATIDNRKNILDKKIEGVRYFLVPTFGRSPQKYNKRLESEWKKINELFNPDVVHIHGTEFPHGLAWVRANGAENVCVSIQGLVSVYSRYYKTESWLDCLPLTFRDFVKLNWISRQRHNFSKRGAIEKELLNSVKHIIGRTEWDKAHSWAINPQACYYHCGETLRDVFYQKKWKYDECEPYSIFVSQGNYPIKGLHKLFEALPLILRSYPNTHVYVGGSNIMEVPWWRKTSYAVLLKRIINKFNLQDNITFVGLLDENQMCERYLKSNIFIMPSAIENSPNSLGEAQVLGVPHLATFVGGIPEIVNYNPAVLYRFEESEMLAKKICEVFSEGDKIETPYFNKMMYDGDKNLLDLENTYQQVYNSK